MPRKRTLDQIKKLDLLKVSELAELNGARYSTVKYYSELGLLPYDQKGQRLTKHYPRIEASERLKDILRLKKQGKTIREIVSHYGKYRQPLERPQKAPSSL